MRLTLRRPNAREAVFGAAVVAAVVGALTERGRGRTLDRRVYEALNRDRGPAADVMLAVVTELGSIWAAAAAAATLAWRGSRREGLDAFGAAAAMWGLGQVAKKAVLRPRPYAALPDARVLIEPPLGTSWPSSHPAVLLAFLTVACRDLDVSRAVRLGAFGLAVAVGLSRVHVGVHYPADVVGGLLLGRAVADAWTTLVTPSVLGRVPFVYSLDRLGP